MKLRKHHYLLAVIFMITVAFHLYFSFQADNFLPAAYFNIQKTNDVFEEEFPQLTERVELSRIFNFSPLFYYVLALFKLLLGNAVFKILPSIMISSLTIVAYFLAKEITNNKDASLFAAFASGFIPVVFSKMVYSVSVYTLILPLTFLLMYTFFKIESGKKYLYLFILLLGILRLTHPSVVILIIVFLVYLIFVKVENLHTSRAEMEIILFSTLLIVWSLFINFKKALLLYGPAIIWQNVPQEILSQYFTNSTILNMISLIGILPFIFGTYTIYKYAFKEKDRKMYLLIAFCLTMALLLWLKLINLDTGLMFLGVALTILLAQYYKIFFTYVSKTKFAAYQPFLVVGVLIIFITTSVIPSIALALSEQRNVVGEDEMDALHWLKQNSDTHATVTATLKEGFLITAIAQRNNILDENFLFIEDAAERLRDTNSIYTTLFTTEAIKLMNKYQTNYLYFSNRAKHEYGKDQLSYTEDPCFQTVFDNGNQIYQLSCKLEER